MPNPHNSSSDEWRGYAKVQTATISKTYDGKISSHSTHRFAAENLRPNDVEFRIAYHHVLSRNHEVDPTKPPKWRLEDDDNEAVTISCAQGASINYQKNFGDIENYRDVLRPKPGGQQKYKLETYTRVQPITGFTENVTGVKAELTVTGTID